MKLLLLRHGPTADTGRLPGGHRDQALLPAARRQWRSISARLALRSPQRILCSDLQRCRLPACELAARLQCPVQILPGLREQDFGDWSAQGWSAVAADHPFFSDPLRTAPPGGESFASCARRVRRVVLPGLDRAGSEETVLILAHAGPLRVLLGAYLGLSTARCLDLAWDPWGLSELHCWGRRGLLLGHNRPG